MLKIWLTVQICLVITICHQFVHGARLPRKNSTDNTWKYSNFAYSAYTSVQFTDNSTLVFRFKTTKKHGMLFYMDDGGVKEFMDGFLLNGQLRVRITMGTCQGKQRFINGSFADLKWHKLTLQRISESVIVKMDSSASIYLLCHGLRRNDFTKHGPLYVSYFPFQEWGKIKWKFRDSLLSSFSFGGFEGCIKTPKFAVGNQKLRRAHLLKNERTVPGCRDACKDPSFGGKCHNGGKCVNKIVRRECDCRGTGFNGPNCSRVALVDSVAGLQFQADSESGSFAEFSGWPMPKRSELQFYFKTGSRKSAILLYQDNGVSAANANANFLEVSLTRDGYVQLYLRGNRCSPEKRFVRRNFIDSTWHRLTIARNGVHLNLSVDNISTEAVTCISPPRFSGFNGKAQNSLYMGGIPFDSQGNPTSINKWSQTGLFLKILQENSWFQGCIALLRYSTEAKPFRNVKLLRYEGVFRNCSGEACSSSEQNKCQNGGRCVDLVVKAECDCDGTGHYGRFCQRRGTSNGNTTLLTNEPDYTGPKNNTSNNNNGDDNSSNDENKNNGNDNNGNKPSENTGGATAGKNKKARNGASTLVVSPPLWLSLSMATVFMRLAGA